MSRANFYSKYRKESGKTSYKNITWPSGDVPFWRKAYRSTFGEIIRKAEQLERPKPLIQNKRYKAIVYFIDENKIGVKKYRTKEFDFSANPYLSPSLLDKQFQKFAMETYFNDFGFVTGNPTTFQEFHDLQTPFVYVYIYNYQITPIKPIKKNIGSMPVREVTFNKLNLNIESNNDNIETICFKHYMNKYYGKIRGTKKFLNLINDKDELTLDQFIFIMKKFNIPFKCYDLRLKIYDQLNQNKSKIKQFLFIASNKHIYPLSKSELSGLYSFKGTDKYTIKNIEYKKDLDNFTIEQMKKEPVLKFKVMIISDFKNADFDIVYGFERVLFGNTLYVSDEELFKVINFNKKYFDLYNIKFNCKITDGYFFLSHVNKLYSSYCNSLGLPYTVRYNDEKIIKDLKTVDQSRAFSSALYSLDYIPVFDSTTHIQPYNDEPIIDTNFYYVEKVNESFYDTIGCGFQSGLRLLELHRSYYTISHFCVPNLKPNPFKQYMKEFFKLDSECAKFATNQFVGMCNKTNPGDGSYYNNLTNSEEEAGTICPNPLELGVGLYCNVETFENKNKFMCNMLPICHYVQDYVGSRLIKDLGLLLDIGAKIRNINVDSITYSHSSKVGDTFYLSSKFNCYKEEEPKIRTTKHIFKYEQKLKSIKQIKYEDFKIEEHLDENLLFDCWPGVGKTYCIQNEIIPAILNYKEKPFDDGLNLDFGIHQQEKEQIKKTYLVTSVKHSALTSYYSKKLNAKVIQKFLFNKKSAEQFRDYDYIIVDEGALLEPYHYEFIYKNLGKDSKLLFLGDKKQLLPYGSEYGAEHQWTNLEIINKFDLSVEMTKNYRNDYTLEDYIKMQNLEYELTDFENKLIKRKSKLNICVTLAHKDELNKEIIEEKGWTDTFGHLKVKKGGRLIAIIKNTSLYPKFTKAKVYNSSFYKIIDYDDKKIILENEDNNKKCEVPVELFRNNFDYGYTITAFRSQGLSIPYKDIGIFDLDILKKDGRLFYTVFSRIQTKNL